MPSRLFASAVILFWLGTTGWLARSVLLPGMGRTEPVSAEEAMGAFFRWNDSTSLTILENGVKIGQMTVSGTDESGPSGEERGRQRSFSTSGTLDEPVLEKGGSSALMGLMWRMNADFGAELAEWERMRATLTVPRQALDVRIEVEGEPSSLAARVDVAGATVFQTGKLSVDDPVRPSRGRSNARSVSPGTAMGGFAFPAMESASGTAGLGLPGDAAAWKPSFRAARGSIEIAGRKLPVYAVEVRLGDAPDGAPVLRLYLSEAGEPLKIETDWGFEAIAEVLIPVVPQS